MPESAQVDAAATTRTVPDEPVLLREDAEGICTLTLNRPKSRNALSDELIAEIQGQLDSIAGDRSVRVALFAASGKVFCAGHDLKEVRAKSGLDEFQDLFRRCSDMMLSIIRLDKPVIAVVEGMATAAGCQLAATCDMVVASEGASFATPGVHIGLFCSTPMVALSRKVGRQASMEMLMTGAPVDAGRAYALGLVNHVVPEGRAMERAREIAGTIAAKSPLTVAIGKEAFYRQLEMPVGEAYGYASEVMAKNMMARDAQEGIDAFVGKRKPVWKGE